VALFSFIVASLGLLANILSVGTASWLISPETLKMSVGIFRHCDFDSTYCGEMAEISAIVDAQEVAWFRAVQALFLLACLGSLLICILIGLVLIRFFDSPLTFRVIAGVNFVTVISEVLAITFFGLYYRNVFALEYASDDYLGYSYYVAIMAVVFLFLSLVASSIEASQTSKVLQNMQHRLTVWSTPYTLFVEQEA